MFVLAAFLALTMTEHGFQPTPREERTTWGLMLKTVQDARHMARRQPVLLALLGTGLFYGLYSEGFDRLWTPHLLHDFQGPWGSVAQQPLRAAQPVVWFGLIEAVLLGLGLATTEVIRRRVDTRRPLSLRRVLMVNAALIILALAGFGLAANFWVALVLYWLIGVLRAVAAPLHTAWLNLSIDDPQVRATLFSVSGQADAIGQIAGGPAVGAVGNVSIRAALVISALLLSPTLPLYALAGRRGSDEKRE